MNRKLKQIVLPIIIIAVVLCGIAVILLAMLSDRLRSENNQEMAGLIGQVISSGSQVDAATIIKSLQVSATEAEIQRGREILSQYGYHSDDFVGNATQVFAQRILIILILVILGFTILVITYFWIRDYREQKRLEKLVEYLHALDNQIHDLKLTENSEEQLSILTNELYKIMISLKTIAKNNQTGRQNLENALADISHQLRTPLTSLQIMIDNIYHEPEMPVAVRQDFLQSISRQVEQMSSLVTTLLHLAKIDNQTIKMNNQTITAKALLGQVLLNLEALADLNAITIETTGDLQAKVKLDAHWQSEALTNIVKNCLEHSPKNSKIVILAQDCPLFLKLIIQDFGEGIATEDLRHVFERFYKAKNSAATSIGIGLSFAKTIIEANNGQIKVQSRVGEGTKFTITYFK